MCCSSKISASFVTLSILALVSICILSIIDLIFASLTPLKKEQFIMPEDSSELKDYSKEFYLTLLNDLEFGQNLYNRSNYGFTGNGIKEICFAGQCSNDNSHFWTTSNCSESCFDSLDSCYDENGKECRYMFCTYYYKIPEKICKNYNAIYKWRNYELKEDTRKFYFVPLYDIINLNGKFRKGYKLCGKTNEINYLLSEEDKCPINKIILNNDKNPPTDFKYETRQMGDDIFIHFSRENTKGYIYRGLYVTSDAEKKDATLLEKIDTDTFENFYKYNPYIYDGKFNKYLNYGQKISSSWKAYLNKWRLNLNQTADEFQELQEEYNIKSTLYTQEKIDEMNDYVRKYKVVLIVFEGVTLGYLFFYCSLFVTLYSSNNCECNCNECNCYNCYCCGFYCDGLCVNANSIKRVILFYLAGLPVLFFTFFSFFVTLAKKRKYNDYASMEYIEDYKNYKNEDDFWNPDNYDNFGNSKKYNNAQFIVLTIKVVIFILYPILVCFTSPPKPATTNNLTSKKLKKEKQHIELNDNKVGLTSAYYPPPAIGYNYNQGYIQTPQIQGPLYPQAPNYYPPPQTNYAYQPQMPYQWGNNYYFQ